VKNGQLVFRYVVGYIFILLLPAWIVSWFLLAVADVITGYLSTGMFSLHVGAAWLHKKTWRILEYFAFCNPPVISRGKDSNGRAIR
jgi:hypothetical protein